MSDNRNDYVTNLKNLEILSVTKVGPLVFLGRADESQRLFSQKSFMEDEVSEFPAFQYSIFQHKLMHGFSTQENNNLKEGS